MPFTKAHLLIFSIAAFAMLSSCSKPNLPTSPPFHMKLSATFAIDGKTYPVDFTWIEENYVAWNEGQGWHTEWRSTHHSFVRALDEKHAVVVWLPSYAEKDLDHFHPNCALIDRKDLRFLRHYPELAPGEKRDGVFELTQLKIERSATPVPKNPMTSDEESLKSAITRGGYGYLYGMRFDKDQWSRSTELQQIFSPLTAITPLGTMPKRRQDSSPTWSAFANFNAGIAMSENMDRHLFGFQFQGDAWTPLPYQGVYQYRQGLKDDSAPVWVLYHGYRFDQQHDELLFDAPAGQLAIFWRYPLESLDAPP